jgi:hypothetical protein
MQLDEDAVVSIIFFIRHAGFIDEELALLNRPTCSGKLHCLSFGQCVYNHRPLFEFLKEKVRVKMLMLICKIDLRMPFFCCSVPFFPSLLVPRWTFPVFFSLLGKSRTESEYTL